MQSNETALETFARLWLKTTYSTASPLPDLGGIAGWEQPTHYEIEIVEDSSVYHDRAHRVQHREWCVKKGYSDTEEEESDKRHILAFEVGEKPVVYDYPTGYRELRTAYRAAQFHTGSAFRTYPTLANSDYFDRHNCAILDPFTHSVSEWVEILHDRNSVDNGYGILLINCNKEGQHYGELIFYSGADEGCLYYAPFQFEDWIAIMIDERTRILRHFHDHEMDAGSAQCDCENRGSIVDYFSYDGKFDSSEYFQRRCDVMKTSLGGVLILSILDIVAGYVLFTIPAKWGCMDRKVKAVVEGEGESEGESEDENEGEGEGENEGEGEGENEGESEGENEGESEGENEGESEGKTVRLIT